MPTALILVTGPRGDHEPAIALAATLISTCVFDSVHVVMQGDCLHLLPFNSRIFPHVLPYTQHSITRLVPSNNIRRSAKRPFAPADLTDANNRHHQAVLTQFVIPSLPFVHPIAVSIQPRIVLSTPLCAPVATTLAEHLAIPHVRLHLLPITPNSRIPHPLANESSPAHAASLLATLRHITPPPNRVYLASYIQHNHRVMGRALPLLNSLRKHLRLPPLPPKAGGDLSIASARPGHVINAYPSRLAPRVPDWLSCVHCVSPIAQDYLPAGWRPDMCPQLATFLARTPRKPILVTLGSVPLPNRRRRAILQILFSAFRTLNLAPVVLIKDTAARRPVTTSSGSILRAVTQASEETIVSPLNTGLSNWVGDNVFICDENPPFAWLLPHCDSVVCHGGVGTISAALRAGIPIMVAPFTAEQVFWGRLITATALGAVVLPDIHVASQSTVRCALRRTLSKLVRTNVIKAGSEIRAKRPGADHAAEIIGRIAYGDQYKHSSSVACVNRNRKYHWPAWS